MARKAKLAVLVSGSGTNMAALLYASRLADAAFEIVLVASNNPDAKALALAKAEGVETFAISHKGMERSAHDTAMDSAIRASGAEFVALAGYMRVLGADMVAGWEGRMLNIHPSLLPKYKGLGTHARAIEAGDTHGGCSVHLVTAQLDAGEVLGQSAVIIMPDDTPDALAARVLIAEHQLYARTLNAYISRGDDPAWLYAQVDALAMALPEAESRSSHGSPGWYTGGKSGKFFAHFSQHHHGSDHIAVLVKTGSADEVSGLAETAPSTYFKPAYYGASGWVGIILNRPDVDWDHISQWLERSWRMAAPKRLTKMIDVADEF